MAKTLFNFIMTTRELNKLEARVAELEKKLASREIKKPVPKPEPPKPRKKME
jgi:BMFP domain-containing protein YqiC